MLENEDTNQIRLNIHFKSIFQELNASEIQELLSVMRYVHKRKGEPVFSEGSYPRGLYYVYQGKIKVIQTGLDGKEQILHFAKDADIMGYRAILSGDEYSCSAVAMVDSSIYFIPKACFFSLIEKNLKFALQLFHLFSKELKQAEKKITSIAQRPVKERIAQSIIQLIDYYGFEKDDSTMAIVITREEIANISGTTRETVIRILTEFQEDKILTLIGKKIRILQYAALHNAANHYDRSQNSF